MEIKTDQNDSKPESSSDSDSQSEDVLKSKKAKIDLRQDLSKYQYNYPWMYWNVSKNGYICSVNCFPPGQKQSGWKLVST